MLFDFNPLGHGVQLQTPIIDIDCHHELSATLFKQSVSVAGWHYQPPLRVQI
jgi:hypothetical protein